MRALLLFFCFLIFGFYGFAQADDPAHASALRDSIVHMDSLMFGAYNRCDVKVFADCVSEDMEFYHDRGGLTTSKKMIVEGLKNNICGKVRRELKPGSLEIYEIPGYGAVEMGMHRFHNLVENSTSNYSKFVQLWKRENGQWRLTRVISLH
jgi:Domain of unknown function (DUF4440)